MEKLSQQEEMMMQAIWQCKEGFVRNFIALLPEGHKDLPYTTAASIVKNIEKKQFVSAKRMGNSIFYRPIISQEQYRKNSFSDLIRNYFGGSYKSLVAAFIKEDKISPKDLKEIIDLIDKKR